MKSQVPVAVAGLVFVAVLGVFAYLITRPSPPPPAGPPIRRAPTATPAPTVPAIPKTREGYLACLSERGLDDAIRFATAGDTVAVDRMVERRECIVLRAGVEVTVVRRIGLGVVEFAVRGEPSVRFFTIAEAIAGG